MRAQGVDAHGANKPIEYFMEAVKALGEPAVLIQHPEELVGVAIEDVAQVRSLFHCCVGFACYHTLCSVLAVCRASWTACKSHRPRQAVGATRIQPHNADSSEDDEDVCEEAFDEDLDEI